MNQAPIPLDISHKPHLSPVPALKVRLEETRPMGPLSPAG